MFDFKNILKFPGFAVMDSGVDAEQMKQEIMGLVAEDSAAGTILDTDGSLRPRNVLRSPAVSAFVRAPALLAAAAEVLGPRPILNSVGANCVLPGAPGMGAHMDYPYFAGADPKGQVIHIQLILALDGMDEKNGATHFMPWPHFSGKEGPSIPIHCKPGTLIVAHGAILHGVCPNTSDAPRTNLLIGMTPWWVRPFNNLQAGRTSEEMNDPDFRSLIGLNVADRVAEALQDVQYGVRRREG